MKKGFIRLVLFLSGLIFVSAGAWAQGGMTIGSVAANITGSFNQITLFLTSASYVIGVTCLIIAILQFKQHKESPQQTPLSKPMMILAMGTALIFIPTITEVASQTFFKGSGQSAGPAGTIIG